ncbi:MAG: hypothetical protein QG647_804 [Patescibacteria group bacterium]|nr:hypothetical protein [Patescibacteria group bacterium]
MRTFREEDFNKVKKLQEYKVSNKDISKLLGWSISTIDRVKSEDTYRQHKEHVKQLSKPKQSKLPAQPKKIENNTLDIDKRLANIENGIKGLFDNIDNLYSNLNLNYSLTKELSNKVDNLPNKKKRLF